MTNLSPAAQTVLDAFLKTPGEEPMPGWNYGRDIAAALRAAADQAIPVTKTPWSSTLVPVLTAQESRNLLLAIAAELDGTHVIGTH
jgi:hypothetical protein